MQHDSHHHSQSQQQQAPSAMEAACSHASTCSQHGSETSSVPFPPHKDDTSKYLEKRYKNNAAARRSREKRRLHDAATEKQLEDLKQENRLLLEEIQRFRELGKNLLLRQATTGSGGGNDLHSPTVLFESPPITPLVAANGNGALLATTTPFAFHFNDFSTTTNTIARMPASHGDHILPTLSTPFPSAEETFQTLTNWGPSSMPYFRMMQTPFWPPHNLLTSPDPLAQKDTFDLSQPRMLRQPRQVACHSSHLLSLLSSGQLPELNADIPSRTVPVQQRTPQPWQLEALTPETDAPLDLTQRHSTATPVESKPTPVESYSQLQKESPASLSQHLLAIATACQQHLPECPPQHDRRTSNSFSSCGSSPLSVSRNCLNHFASQQVEMDAHHLPATVSTGANAISTIGRAYLTEEERYRERRRRNNEAVRRCRENKRARLQLMQQMKDRVSELQGLPLLLASNTAHVYSSH